MALGSWQAGRTSGPGEPFPAGTCLHHPKAEDTILSSPSRCQTSSRLSPPRTAPSQDESPAATVAVFTWGSQAPRAPGGATFHAIFCTFPRRVWTAPLPTEPHCASTAPSTSHHTSHAATRAGKNGGSKQAQAMYQSQHPSPAHLGLGEYKNQPQRELFPIASRWAGSELGFVQ